MAGKDAPWVLCPAYFKRESGNKCGLVTLTKVNIIEGMRPFSSTDWQDCTKENCMFVRILRGVQNLQLIKEEE